MNKNQNLLIVFLAGIVFTAVFYHQMLGFNLFLYNILILFLLLFVYKSIHLKNKAHLVLAAGTFLTAVGTLVHASAFVITLNILSLIALFGTTNNGKLKNLVNVAFAGVIQFFLGIIFVFQNNQPISRKETKSYPSFVKWLTYGLIPLALVILFALLYVNASSKFREMFRFVPDFFDYVFKQINFPMCLLFLFGFMIAAAFFTKTQVIQLFGEPETDALRRKRNPNYLGKITGLTSEFRIAVLSFIALNVLLFIFNCVDIWTVWINFSWDGALLKEFVHEGTYTLIFTLGLSLLLVLIFFRKNLNFYSKNKSLKILANTWIIQNAILAVSVLIRNLHYINYYNLAYLRIGVLMFLILVFVGLISVFLKINCTKNFAYLMRINALAAYLVLAGFSLPDWDVIIAKFNFSRSDKALVHLSFLSGLDQKALPYLIKTEAELAENDPVVERIGRKDARMSQPEYIECIEKRIQNFLLAYPQRTFLEWNYADWKAYQKLRTKIKPAENKPVPLNSNDTAVSPQ